MFEKKLISLGKTINLRKKIPEYSETDDLAMGIAASMIPGLQKHLNKIEEIETALSDIKVKQAFTIQALQEAEEELESAVNEEKNLRKSIQKTGGRLEESKTELENRIRLKNDASAQLSAIKSNLEARETELINYRFDEADLANEITNCDKAIADGENEIKTLIKNREAGRKKAVALKRQLKRHLARPWKFFLFRWIWLLFHNLGSRKSFGRQTRLLIEQLELRTDTFSSIEANLGQSRAGLEELKAIKQKLLQIRSDLQDKDYDIAGMMEETDEKEDQRQKMEKEIAEIQREIDNEIYEQELNQANLAALKARPWSFFPFRWIWLLFHNISHRPSFGMQARLLSEELKIQQEKIDALKRNHNENNELFDDFMQKLSRQRFHLSVLKSQELKGNICEEKEKQEQVIQLLDAFEIEELMKINENMENEIAELEDEIVRLNIDGLKQNITRLKDEIEELYEEIGRTKRKGEDLQVLPQVVDGFAALGYPLIPLIVRPVNETDDTSGLAFIIDPDEAPNKTAVIPNVTIDEDEIHEAMNAISDFDIDMVLVKPDEKEISKLGRIDGIYGSELQFKNAIITLIKLSEQNEPQKYELPLITDHDEIGRLIGEISADDSPETGYSRQLIPVHWQEIEKYEHCCAMMMNLFVKAQSLKDIDEKVRLAEEKLEITQANSTAAREIAGEIGAGLIQDAQLNSKLVRYYYYCPKCNVLPLYFSKLHEIDIERLGDLKNQSHEVLLRRLRIYLRKVFKDESGKQLNETTRKQISESWECAFSALGELLPHIEKADTEAEQQSDPVIKKFFEGRRKTQLKLYREIVLDLLFNPYKVWDKNLSYYQKREKYNLGVVPKTKSTVIENTKLTYYPDNPEEKRWYCANCRNSFSQEIAETGIVNKIEKDIKSAVFRSLWSEDAVWSQITNLIGKTSKEIRDNRIKETKTLLEPIKTYNNEILALRSRIEEALATGLAVNGKLKQLSDEFTTLGILEDKEIERLNDFISTTNSYSKEVETLLEKMRIKEDEMQAVPSTITRDRENPNLPLQIEDDREMVMSLFVRSNTEPDRTDEVNTPVIGEESLIVDVDEQRRTILTRNETDTDWDELLAEDNPGE